jgi:hypothetical protein
MRLPAVERFSRAVASHSIDCLIGPSPWSELSLSLSLDDGGSTCSGSFDSESIVKVGGERRIFELKKGMAWRCKIKEKEG